jgi:prepilin-type N-terminal cleavage/methylation domain-containing protein
MDAETKGYKPQASKLCFLGQPLFAGASERPSPIDYRGCASQAQKWAPIAADVTALAEFRPEYGSIGHERERQEKKGTTLWGAVVDGCTRRGWKHELKGGLAARLSTLFIWREIDQRRKPAQISSGFTLIELMVAVVVIAILSTIAFPSYTEYIKRSRISDGLAPLAQYRLQMEQASQDNGNYGVTTCAVAALTATAYFTFGCALGANAQSFTATATGTGTMAGYAYTVDDTGAQKTTAYPGRTGLPASCWLTRKGDC